MHNTKSFVLVALTNVQKENKNMLNIIKTGIVALVTLIAMVFAQDIYLSVSNEIAKQETEEAIQVIYTKGIEAQADRITRAAVEYANYVSINWAKDSVFYNYEVKHTHKTIVAGESLRADILRQLNNMHFLHGREAFKLQGVEWIGNTDNGVLNDAMIPSWK